MAPGQTISVASDLPYLFQIEVGLRRIPCRLEYRGMTHVIISIGGRLMTLGALQRVVYWGAGK